MAVTEPQAVMPQSVITDEMIATMAAKVGYAVNQRGEVVMPGHAVIALPSRDAGASPAARKARKP